MRARLVTWAAVACSGVTLAATGGVTSATTIPDESATAEPAPSSSPPPSTVSPAPASSIGGPATSPASTGGEWEQIAPGGDCQCADGGEWSYFVRAADPSKVVFVLQGGGGCWSAETCDPANGPYDSSVTAEDDPAGLGGMFDLANPDNPFAGWSMVFVPYCTGDVHIGDTTQDYDGLTIEHKGAVNGITALDGMQERFPDADQVAVVGISAGSVAAPLYGGMAADRYPDADIVVFGDGSGAYPRDRDVYGSGLLESWGFATEAVDWPEAADIASTDWDLTMFWTVAAEHAPELELSRFDFAYDAAQDYFIGLVGAPPVDLLEQVDDNEATIEAAGTNMQSYTAAGDGHTVTLDDGLYDMDVDGSLLTEWLAQLLAGDEPVPDVRCTDCEPTPTTSPSGSPADTAAPSTT